MLNQLQNVGAIPSKYKEVDFSKCVYVTECSDEIPEDATLVIDDCVWAATVRGEPVEMAQTIYSGDAAGNVGVFSRRSLRFSKKVLDGNTLRTIQEKVFKIKEEQSMDNMFSAEALQAALQGGAGAQAAPAATFNDAAATAAASTPVGKGTILGFITKTNSTVKASLKDPTKIGPDGKAMKGVTDPAQIVFKNAGPGQIIGAIIEMPAANGGKAVKIFDKDEAQIAIAKKFGGVVSESEAILGRGIASQITLKSSAVKGANAPTDGIRASFVLKSRLSRSTVLTEGNYLPMKVFETGSINQNCENNVKKLFSGKRTTDELAPEYQDVMKDGQVSVPKLTALGAFTIPCYNNRKVTMTKPMLPVVETYVKKSGATGYRFKMISDLNTILTRPEYKKIVDATEMNLSELAMVLTSKFSKRKNVVNNFDVDEFLQAVKAGHVLNGKKEADCSLGVMNFDELMRGIEDVI